MDGSELGVSVTSSNVDTSDNVNNFALARFNFSTNQDLKITKMIF